MKKLYVPLAIVAVIGAIISFWAISRHRLRSVPGKPIGEVFVGETLIVIDHVAVGGNKGGKATTEDNRLVALDAKTGEALATDVGEYSACWAGPPRVICGDKFDQISFLDPRTLDPIATANDLIAAANLPKPARRYEKAPSSVYITLSDGRAAQIDPATLAVTPVDSVPWQRPDTGQACDTTDHLVRGEQRLVLQYGTRRKLTTDPPPPAESATPRAPAPDFLDGQFLRTDDAVLVLHKETVDGRHAITRIDETTFATKWTLGLPGACRTYGLAGSILAVAVDNRENRALGIDITTGRLVWQHSF